MQTVKLAPTNLIAVTVPEYAIDIKLNRDGYGRDEPYYISYCKPDDSYRDGFDTNLNIGSKYEIIGTVTKDSIDFDTSQCIKKNHVMHGGYMDYLKNKDQHIVWKCQTANESFISLLEANGIYLKNPLKKPIFPNENRYAHDGQAEFYDYQYNQWQEMESKVLPVGTKLLIIKQI